MSVPTTVIGGYLGAGKTTLVNHLLRHADGLRIAVLVNDFGDTAIDAAVIEGAQGGVLALAGGCVCCSYGADLLGSLQQLLARTPQPERVLIECSGVGLPAAVARTARLAQGLSVEGVIVLADMTTLTERAADRYVGDTVQQQLRDADLIVLNKHDLAGAAQRDGARAWLARHVPATPHVEAERAALPNALLLGPIERVRPSVPTAAFGVAPSHAAQRFSSHTRRFDAPVDVAALSASLTAPGCGVLRAKGFVTDLDGQRWLLQVVGRRCERTPVSRGEAADATDRLLVISVAA